MLLSLARNALRKAGWPQSQRGLELKACLPRMQFLCANRLLLQRETALMRIERPLMPVSDESLGVGLLLCLSAESFPRNSSEPSPRAYDLPVTCLATGTWSHNSAKYGF